MLRERIVAYASSLGVVVTLAAISLSVTEGVSLTPYKDGGGVKTWCYGQTVGVPKAQYTASECLRDLVTMTDEYYKAVRPWLRKDTPDSVAAAFTSTAVNIGKAGWRGSQFTNSYVEAPYMQALRDGNWKLACAKLEAPWPGKYGTAPGYKATIGGYPSKGLGNRRAIDAKLCRSGL